MTKVYDGCSERPPFMRRCNLFDVHFRSSVSQDSFSFESICIYIRNTSLWPAVFITFVLHIIHVFVVYLWWKKNEIHVKS